MIDGSRCREAAVRSWTHKATFASRYDLSNSSHPFMSAAVMATPVSYTHSLCRARILAKLLSSRDSRRLGYSEVATIGVSSRRK